ncbi:MAG: hypothetical protein JXR83_09145 [Deltaproteobacteria bacterium]|nr:hypothetical protein [Deltaproteobacteria bacterium]
MAAAIAIGLLGQTACALCNTGATDRTDAGHEGGGCVDPDDAASAPDRVAHDRLVEDAGPLLPCPDDMVEVGVFCADRYEASRDDATSEIQGELETVARSRRNVIPWHVEQMSEQALVTFGQACAAAGKRLCLPDEWLELCSGPENSLYGFSGAFSAEICNCVDTFCDDYCAEQEIPLESCNVYADCGYSCGLQSPPSGVRCYHVMPTGSFPSCTSSHGAYDVSGNVWEVVPSTIDPRGYEVRGGAFNCASAAARLMCTYNAGWTLLNAGFRCCLDRR